MSKFTNPLNNIRIASPCPADWNRMVGDNRQRHCGECKLNVYNLSGMTRSEAENLISNSEGRICMRIYRRADGTILTKDCPVGWQAVKQKISKTAAAFVSVIFAILSGIGITSYFNNLDNSRTMGTIIFENPNPPIYDDFSQPGEIKPRTEKIKPMMGNIAVDTPNENYSDYEMGEMLSKDLSSNSNTKIVEKSIKIRKKY